MKTVATLDLVKDADARTLTLAISVPWFGKPTYHVTVRENGVLANWRRYTHGADRLFPAKSSELRGSWFHAMDAPAAARRDFVATAGALLEQGFVINA